MSIQFASEPTGIAAAKAKGSHVYFVQCTATGAVKIGYSQKLSHRIASLQTGASGKIRLIRAIDGGKARERWLHKKFAHLRLRGEWFEFHPDMMTVTPPDEIIVPTRIVQRRDVMLTVTERLRQAEVQGKDLGLCDKQVLLAFVATLSNTEARELLDYVAARELAAA